MSYRPPDWEEIKKQIIFHSAYDYGTGSQFIEAGADALLKGLLSQENTFYTNSTQIKEFCKKHKGWLVFIPEAAK